MSYSFNIKAANKEAAKAAVSAKMEEIVSLQPGHARDQMAVCANAFAAIDHLVDDDTMDINIAMNGSTTYYGGKEDELRGVAISCNIYYVERQAVEHHPV